MKNISFKYDNVLKKVSSKRSDYYWKEVVDTVPKLW